MKLTIHDADLFCRNYVMSAKDDPDLMRRILRVQSVISKLAELHNKFLELDAVIRSAIVPPDD